MTGQDTVPVEAEVPPDPGALIESMRAFGYSLPTAVADLIDNSISAGASSIEVRFEWDGPRSIIAVLDDGCGMDELSLVEAMRLGSRSPLEARAANDLGRFGLGLKSAAWSQARSLTVLSRTADGPLHTRRWDLDHVSRTRRWSLLSTSTAEGHAFAEEVSRQRTGTAVLLEQLDRLVGDEPVEDEAAHTRFMAAVRSVEEHLGMVFHRFLAGPRAIVLRVNGRPVKPWDPFLEHESATQRLPTEDLPIAGRKVHVAPYVLPHFSKLDAEAHADASGVRGWNAQQGFYVYRSRRLLVAGDWLGLSRMQQEEHYKLARIRIDLDNTMDHVWQIDVRKATARIPGALQPELRRIAQATRQRAAEAYRFRGKAAARGENGAALRFVWERTRHRGGVQRFRVNRRHPVISSLVSESTEVARAVESSLRLAEENLPVEAIVLEARERPDDGIRVPFSGSEAEVGVMLRSALANMVAEGIPPAMALTSLAMVEPFESYPELIHVLEEELR